MLCQRCKKNEAKIHLVKMVNSKKSEVWLCEECARALSNNSFFTMISQGDMNSLEKMIGEYFGEEQNVEVKVDIICKNCGTTYSQYKESGVLGCPECYESFKEYLSPVIEQIHGRYEYKGKVPPKKLKEESVTDTLKSLKLELQKCIIKEEYEKAAVIRDKINEIKTEREVER